MQVAIIGAGNVGTALATALTRAGHEVTITSRDPEDAGRVAAATGATAVAGNARAADAADIVVLAVGFDSIAGIAEEIGDRLGGKTVVDVTNRISFGPGGAEIDTTSSNAEAVAALLPKATVIKAFNTIFGSHLADPITDTVRLDGFVAGDDADAKATILELVESIGFSPIDAGPLVRARQLEGLAFLNMVVNIEHSGSWRSGWKLVAAPETVPVRA
jgi:hypothetical protein